MPEYANSVMLTRPTHTMPASRSRATTGASCNAGDAFANTRDPAVVGNSAISKKSFHAIGTPSSGPCAQPSRARRAAARASRCARSCVTTVKIAGSSHAAIAASVRSASASASIAPPASNAPSCSAEFKLQYLPTSNPPSTTTTCPVM